MILILRDSLIILFYLRHLSGCIQASVWWIAIIHAPLRGVGPSNRCQDVLRDVGTFLKCEGVLWPPSPGNRCVYYTYTVYIYICVYLSHIFGNMAAMASTWFILTMISCWVWYRADSLEILQPLSLEGRKVKRSWKLWRWRSRQLGDVMVPGSYVET